MVSPRAHFLLHVSKYKSSSHKQESALASHLSRVVATTTLMCQMRTKLGKTEATFTFLELVHLRICQCINTLKCKWSRALILAHQNLAIHQCLLRRQCPSLALIKLLKWLLELLTLTWTEQWATYSATAITILIRLISLCKMGLMCNKWAAHKDKAKSQCWLSCFTKLNCSKCNKHNKFSND